MMKSLTGTLSFSKPRPTEVSVTMYYIVAIEDDGYTVFIFSEPDEEGHLEFVTKRSIDHPRYADGYVRQAIKAELQGCLTDLTVYEEGING
jgi:hypothetical protein